MDRSSKLADLKLVSKYYPVTNYSYPQSQYGRSRFSNDRASLGSDSSAPGLIDDRTDSEVSFDDDYQYHAHATELWDSFWQPSKPGHVQPQPRKQYPALIPSPRQRRKQETEERRAWPLPENPQSRNQKLAASYSPFPKPLPLPPRASLMVPSWQSSHSPTGKPPRPPRPDEYRCLHPPSPLASPIIAQFATSPDPFTTNFSRPVTPKEPGPATSSGIAPVTPPESRNSGHSVYSLAAAAALPPPESKSLSSKKSMPCLRPLSTPKPETETETETKPEPEPHSIFEDDDSDSEETRPGAHSRSFFRFHKRPMSDTRKGVKDSGQPRRLERRYSRTAPPSTIRRPPPHTSKSGLPAGQKRHGGDVIGRMLRRRRSRG